MIPYSILNVSIYIEGGYNNVMWENVPERQMDTKSDKLVGRDEWNTD